MQTPATRTLQLLALLQSGREWSAADLAAQLRVSERTVRRDAQRLRDLGYDVVARPGPGGAYRLRPGVRIPPLLLDADDISTIIVSLLLREARSPGDPSVTTARLKLEQALTPELRRRAAATALSTHIVLPDGPPTTVDGAVIGTIADAVATGGRLRFEYRDRHDRASCRTVQPHRHVLREHRWYIVAYDIDRAAWRLFRMDRMRDVTRLPGRYQPRDFPFDSIESWLATDFGRSG